MGKGKKKKFIDKNNATTYDILHRSQKDPLAADEEAPQRVLVAREPVQEKKIVKKSVRKAEKRLINQDISKKREEQIHHGIFYDDEYDYTQHLKDTKNLGSGWERIEKKDDEKIKLPPMVFASIPEEEVGLLNKAAPISGPRPDLDPDIVAAMDEDFDFDDPDNEIDDDFMAYANADESDLEFQNEDSDEDEEDEESDVSSNVGYSDEEKDEVGSLNGGQFTFNDQETGSRFTEYSMSSSVIERNAGLTQLDRKFEKIYAQYDDMEQGPLDLEEIEGYIPPDDERLLQCATEFEMQKREATDNIAQMMKDRLKLVNYTSDSSDDERDLHGLAVEPREREKWDCESVLSTYSTLYNHPKLIENPKRVEKIKINPKTGIPKNVLDGRPGKLTVKGLAQLNYEYEMSKGNQNSTQSVADTMRSTLSILSIRPKDELPEDRKQRKEALREYRKQRREERKANKEAFKEEKKRQIKIALNNKRNVQGNRIL